MVLIDQRWIWNRTHWPEMLCIFPCAHHHLLNQPEFKLFFVELTISLYIFCTGPLPDIRLADIPTHSPVLFSPPSPCPSTHKLFTFHSGLMRPFFPSIACILSESTVKSKFIKIGVWAFFSEFHAVGSCLGFWSFKYFLKLAWFCSFASDAQLFFFFCTGWSWHVSSDCQVSALAYTFIVPLYIKIKGCIEQIVNSSIVTQVDVLSSVLNVCGTGPLYSPWNKRDARLLVSLTLDWNFKLFLFYMVFLASSCSELLFLLWSVCLL